jgi:multicomponent Na+:H+ antiporter subunit C
MTELAVAATVGLVGAVGLYLATSRDLMRIAIGLAMLGSAANLFVFAAGRLQNPAAPLVPPGASSIAWPVANPLPQALVLTAIVIGFALACFAVALVLALQREAKTPDAESLAYAEPPPRGDGSPGMMS